MRVVLFFIYMTFAVIVIMPMRCMELGPIEKELVLREIECKGIGFVKMHVDAAGESVRLQNGFTITPIALQIQMKFKRKEQETDQCTKNIFTAIKRVNGQSEDSYLGTDDTCYYWLNDNRSIVLVVSNIRNKSGLQLLLQEYLDSRPELQKTVQEWY